MRFRARSLDGNGSGWDAYLRYSKLTIKLIKAEGGTKSPARAVEPPDDTGWTFGELGNLQVVRVTDVKVLDTAMERINGEVRSPGGINGAGSIFVVNHNADNTLITLRYRLRKASFEAAEEPFEAAGRKFNRGSFIIRNASSDELGKALTDLGLQAVAVDPAPVVKTHAIKLPRVAILHTWLNTQDEGWWRLAFDQMQVPYDYISTQEVAKDANLNSKYDVIVFGPIGTTANAISATTSAPRMRAIPPPITDRVPAHLRASIRSIFDA